MEKESWGNFKKKKKERKTEKMCIWSTFICDEEEEENRVPEVQEKYRNSTKKLGAREGVRWQGEMEDLSIKQSVPPILKGKGKGSRVLFGV